MCKKSFIMIMISFLVLLLIGTLYDLKISLAIYNQRSIYGRFFEAFGELPGLLVGIFSFASLIVTRNKDVKWKNYGSIVLYGFLLVLLSLMAGFIPLRYINESYSWISFILAIIYIAGSIYLVSKVKKENYPQLKKAAIIGVWTLLLAIIIINGIKSYWGRPRLRSMSDPLTEFTPWYLIQGKALNDEFKSFPSGHSANSAVIIWLTILPTFVSQMKGKERVLLVISLTWIGLVMISRIVMGAHFLSDVSVGAAITIIIYYLFIKYKIKGKKTCISNKNHSKV